jgi:hypothetical protein
MAVSERLFIMSVSLERLRERLARQRKMSDEFFETYRVISQDGTKELPEGIWRLESERLGREKELRDLIHLAENSQQ